MRYYIIYKYYEILHHIFHVIKKKNINIMRYVKILQQYFKIFLYNKIIQNIITFFFIENIIKYFFHFVRLLIK